MTAKYTGRKCPFPFLFFFPSTFPPPYKIPWQTILSNYQGCFQIFSHCRMILSIFIHFQFRSLFLAFLWVGFSSLAKLHFHGWKKEEEEEEELTLKIWEGGPSRLVDRKTTATVIKRLTKSANTIYLDWTALHVSR